MWPGTPGRNTSGKRARMRRWAAAGSNRLARIRLPFALDGAPWNEERVLERYELLYEAGLVEEAHRDGRGDGAALGAHGGEIGQFGAHIGVVEGFEQFVLQKGRHVLGGACGRKHAVPRGRAKTLQGLPQGG